MLQLIEKLNTELSAVREKAALSSLTIGQLMECAFIVAIKQTELSNAEEKNHREVSA